MVGTVGFYTKLHKLTKVNDQNLYLKAEDIANKMRIATGRGDDTRRHFMKQGVKKEELAELGLTELFKKEKVTQQEILEVIADVVPKEKPVAKPKPVKKKRFEELDFDSMTDEEIEKAMFNEDLS